jgi:hypothetical protein
MARLSWTTIQIPFSAGLETKEDPRFSSPPKLDIARDVVFEQVGGLQPRRPCVAMSNAIFGGGALANCRRVVDNDGELCVLTDTGLYSYNAQLAQWVLRGTHLAVAVDEQPRFVTTGDQIDGDRAELNGTIVYAWAEGPAATGSAVYAAAIDKTTGAVLTPPTQIGAAHINAGRPRLVALSTKILLFCDDGAANLAVRAIDPANPAAGFASAATLVLAVTHFGKYDVVRVGATDQCVGVSCIAGFASYLAFTVTAALALNTSTKPRTADGPLAVANTGTTTQVVRGNGVNIQGDLLTTSTLADVFTAQAIGVANSTTINQVTVAYADATTAYAFWTSGNVGETSGFTDFTVKTNSVTTGNVIGTQAVLRHQLGIASRAFAYNGDVYLWLAFASDSGVSATGNASAVRAQLQNSYFLYNKSGTLISRCVMGAGGGFHPSVGVLPGVALVSGGTQFAWAATSRRRIEVGAQATHTAFASRSPRDVVFTFDSNDARRTARLGQTLYIASSIPLQYDGQALVEVGFLVYPWYFEPTVGAAGNLGAGTYTWVATMKWVNAQGEVDRSTTATGMQLAVAASKFVFLNYIYLYVTMKAGMRPPSIDMWRSAANLAAPFYLVTSQDPNAGIVNNGYVANSDTGGAMTPLPDNFADATLTVKEPYHENGDVLEFLAPPGASIIFATDTRLLLLGVVGDPDRLWYSREREFGQVASFHDELVGDVPSIGGRITSGWFQDEILYVGRETSIHQIPGGGRDNTGQGQDIGPSREVSRDVGPVSQEAQAQTPIGTLLKSAKGWQLLRGTDLRYVGGPVSAFDGDTVLAMHVMTSQHQVRILTSARLLLWDYRGAVDANSPDGLGQWAEHTISDGLHATLWSGSYVYLTATGPKIEQTAMTGLTYGLDVETSWIKAGDLQGFAKLGAILILGEYRSAFLLRIRVARDYKYDGAGNVVYFDDKAWTPSPTVVGSALQVRHAPSGSNGNGQAFKVRLTAVAELARATLATSSGLTPAASTSGVAWASTWKVADLVVGRESYFRPGEMGNAVTMSIAFTTGATPSIDVRDHFAYSPTTGRWSEDLNNVGVRVTGTTTTTVAQLEAAITAGTKLCSLVTPDVAPSKTLAIATMAAGSPAIGSFAGGSYTAPTGEALRLTGLGLEVGLQPGLNKRLPAAQKA